MAHKGPQRGSERVKVRTSKFSKILFFGYELHNEDGLPHDIAVALSLTYVLYFRGLG